MSRAVNHKGRREIAARRQARERALQGIYQWLIFHTPGRKEASEPARASLVEQSPKDQLPEIDSLASSVPDESENTSTVQAVTADAAFFTVLLQGTISGAEALRALFSPFLTRSVEELSPVEHAILLLATHELVHDIETPYRVVINEAIELAKKYGGADGHKFVNGVLDRLAAKLRTTEIKT